MAHEASARPLGQVDNRQDRAHALAEWIDALDVAFAQGVRRAGGETRTLQLAGVPVRLHTAGSSMMQQLGGAFAHLPMDVTPAPLLTVKLWDSRTSGMEPPPLPHGGADEPRGAVWYTATERVQIAYQPRLALLSAIDHERATAWFWCADAAALPYWESAAPMRQILHWWLLQRGLLLLHGASIGFPTGGVLIVGRGGSGKSTCALSSLDSPLLYAGDDYVAVEDGGQPWVHSLYSSGKLEPGHSQLLPHLPKPTFESDGSDQDKAVFFLSDAFPDRMCAGFPLRAVLVPSVTGREEPRVYAIKPSAALQALAPSTLLQLHPAQPDAFSRMTRLLQEVPTFALEVGRPAETPIAIERLLLDLAA